MLKQKGKYKHEIDLLRKSCQKESKHVELIQDLLAVQKTKTLMIKKRGFQADIENIIEQYIRDSKTK